MKKLFLLILMFLLVGCSNDAPVKRLETPNNIFLEDYVLVWNEVEDAIQYHVIVNDQEHIVDEARLDLRQFEDGEYVVRVKAVGENIQESLFSIKFTFCFRESIRVPSNIKIENEVLSWSHEQDADKYIVSINGIKHETTKNLFNLGILDENHFYEIQVKGIYRNLDSKYSDVIVYHTFKDKYLTTDEVLIDKNSEDDFIFLFEDEFIIQSIVYMEKQVVFSVDGPQLIIPSNNFQEIPYGKNQLITYTNKGIVEVLFDLYDSRKPYLMSSNTIVYVPGDDVVVEFELYSSELSEMIGNKITTADYIVNGNQIVLRHQYLDNMFNDQERKNLIIGFYLLTNESDDITGFIKIMRD